LADNGFSVTTENVEDLTAIKAKYQVPPELQSCHTAIVDGYILEGHVPVKEINRLLKERPTIAGLAVPGMPIGSPGMVVDGAAAQPYDVVAFDKAGKTEVYASYQP
jgi:hypothetical protein